MNFLKKSMLMLVLIAVTIAPANADETQRVLNLKELPEGFGGSHVRASGDKVIISCFKESPYLLTFSDLAPKRVAKKETDRKLSWVAIKHGNDRLGQGQILSLSGQKPSFDQKETGTPKVTLFLRMSSEEQAQVVEKVLAASLKPPSEPLPFPVEK
ncbi:MAG: hypothetical protein ACO1QS_10810 [Verrucomicrobiota bacterium]